ncbi:hypothetical protein [Bacillus cereus]|uniref:hypothetical protein n=1 Tax=Bacillus cereus TaxID=1396 RepID=UPI0024BC64AA|nr:hypothetical protein [Bacillus cereus]
MTTVNNKQLHKALKKVERRIHDIKPIIMEAWLDCDDETQYGKFFGDVFEKYDNAVEEMTTCLYHARTSERIATLKKTADYIEEVILHCYRSLNKLEDDYDVFNAVAYINEINEKNKGALTSLSFIKSYV